MLGEILRGKTCKFFALAFVIGLAAGTLRAQTSESERIERLHHVSQLIENALERVRFGAEPCSTEACQRQKYRLLAQIRMQVDWLPQWREDELQSRAFLSAYRYLREPMQRPEASDWLQWWKRRYEYEIQNRSLWPQYVQQMADLATAFQSFDRLVHTPSKSRQTFIDHWHQGLAEAAQFLQEAVQLSRLAGLRELEWKDQEAEDLRSEAQTRFDQLRDWEARHGKRISQILSETFPEHQSAQALQLVLHLHTWSKHFDEKDIFQPYFVELLKDQQGFVRQIYRQMQEFNDLEYGVIGLQHYEDGQSPLIPWDEEIEIQKRLDQIEEIYRLGLDASIFFFLFGASQSLAAGSKAIQFSILAPSLYGFQKLDQEISEWALPRQAYSEELQWLRFELEQSLERRHVTLLRTKDALLERQKRVQDDLLQIERSSK